MGDDHRQDDSGKATVIAQQEQSLEDASEEVLRERLATLRKRRQRVRQWRLREQSVRSELESELLGARREQQLALDEFQSMKARIRKHEHFLEIARQWNVLNDAFHIWHSGPFATINGMRLGSEGPSGNFGPADEEEEDGSNNGNGNRSSHENTVVSPPPARSYLLGFGQGQPAIIEEKSTNGAGANGASNETIIKIQWTEINSALGQVALLLATLEQQPHAGIHYRHEIVPHGSTSRIGLRNSSSSSGTTDGGGKATSFYNLYSDDSFQLFGRRNFNIALQSLLQCVRHATMVVSQRDPTIVFPHTIQKTNARTEEYTIGGLSVAYGTDGVEWTRAMKYLLTNVKQLLNYRAFDLFDHYPAQQEQHQLRGANG